MNRKDLASRIDHTLLQVEAGKEDIERLCREALTEGFASVCIHPYWLPFAKRHFQDMRLCTVIGFPLGLQTVKLHEAQKAMEAGAQELDIVVNYALVQMGEWREIEEELQSFRKLFPSLTLKLILETCRLSDPAIIRLCQMAAQVGLDFVKTSTGFAQSGASLAAVRLMKSHSGPSMQVKASGGIRDWPMARAMLEAGADRIGTSSGIAILNAADA